MTKIIITVSTTDSVVIISITYWMLGSFVDFLTEQFVVHSH